MGEVLVLVEQVDGAVKKVTGELLTLARDLGTPSAVWVGPGFDDAAAAALGEFGAATVYVADAADLAALEGWARAHPRLLTFGRQGLFVPDNTHHALAMGWAAADALASDGTFDRSAWSAARDRFAAHVVED